MLTLLKLLLLVSTLFAQRYLPETNIFQSPALILIDTQVESPAVYDGSSSARMIQQGEAFQIQIFAPAAARKSIYEYSFGVVRSPGRPIPLKITSARDWQDRELMSGKPNHTLIFSGTQFRFAVLPRTGHVMTLTFTATENLTDRQPLDVILTLTTVSDPPRRVNQMIARQLLTWS